jgi:hypothetical protein
MTRTIDIQKGTNYFLVAALIAVSGFPYFMVSQIHFLILFLIAIFFYLKRNIHFDLRSLPILGAFVIIETLQFIFIKPFDPIMISGTFVRLLLGFLIISLSGTSFTRCYINLLVFFSLVSFFFFIPSLLIPGFFNFFAEHICPIFDPPVAAVNDFYVIWPTNLIYCFHECILKELRNPGPFWEPGLFAVFLNIALLFQMITEKDIWSWKTGVLMLALLTTLSTAGYIAFFILFFSYYVIRMNPVRKILFSLLVAPAILLLYFSLDFLNTKVKENLDLAGTTTSSRFGSAAVDLADFTNSPWIGWGRGVMRYGGRPYTFFSEDQHRNNSVTDLLATYGIFLTVFFFFNYYKSLKYLCLNEDFRKSFAPYALVVILTLGFSQSIFLRPFFYSLLFLHLIYKTKIANENID